MRNLQTYSQTINPFGDSSLRTFTKKRYQYTGKEKDAESRLYYYGARYYAAWTCRFTSTDPLAAEYPSLSAYAYAFNNPLAFNDPTGMEGERSSASASADNISTDGGGDTGSADGGSTEGSGDGIKKGDTFTDEKGNEHTTSVGEAKVFGEKDSFSLDLSFNPIVRNSQLNGVKNTGGIKYGEGLGFKPDFTEGLSSLYKPLYGALTLPVISLTAPIIVESGIFSFEANITSGLISSGADFGSQMLTESGSPLERFEKVNFTSVVSSGLFKNPFTSAAMGSAFDISFNKGFNSFSNKSGSDMAVDFTTSFTSKFIGNKTNLLFEKQIDKLIFQSVFDPVITTTSGAINKSIKNR